MESTSVEATTTPPPTATNILMIVREVFRAVVVKSYIFIMSHLCQNAVALSIPRQQLVKKCTDIKVEKPSGTHVGLRSCNFD